MTKLLEKALAAVGNLPPDEQDKIARAILRLAADDGEPETVDTAHVDAILDGLAQVQRRELAEDSEVKAAFRRFDS